MLAQNWSAKVEYLYMDFGTHDGSWTFTGLPTINDSTRAAQQHRASAA